MNRIALVLLGLLAVGHAQAQTPTTPAVAAMVCANNTVVPTPVNGQFFYVQCDSNGKLLTNASGGTGTVTSVSVTTANGVSGSVATATTTPAISLTLGAITPSTVAIGAGSAITSSGPGGALASGAFTAAYTLPTATNSVLGGVKPDGTTITNTAGAIAAASTTISGTSCTPGGSCTVTPAVTSFTVHCSRDLTTASGNQTIPNNTDCGAASFGFTPSACDFFGAVVGSLTNQYITYNGSTDSARTQAALYGISTAQYYLPGFVMVLGDGANQQTANVSAYNATTLTLAWTKSSSPTGTASFSVRCFK